jgi:four helix bundle protein
MGNFRELVAWQQSMDLVLEVYDGTRSSPKEELYGLTSQIRRSAVSIPSNIAEGQGRRSDGEFLQFLGTARGSLLELETQLLIASRLGYLPAPRSDSLLARIAELGRVLNGFMSALQRTGRKK